MILFCLHLRVDMYMVQGWLGAAALGQYSIAVTLAETLMMATDAVAVAVLPAQMTNTVQESAQRALRAARINVLLGTGLALAAAIVSGPAITLLYGESYRPAVLPMIALLPGIVSLGMQRVCGAPTLRTGRPLGIAGIYALTLTTNIILNMLLIRRYGLIGASIASSVSYILGAGIFVTWTSRLAQLPLSRVMRFDAADLASVSAAVRLGVAMLRGMLPPAREPL
jgi:O-antigen/teichoic acid export membrane protein